MRPPTSGRPRRGLIRFAWILLLVGCGDALPDDHDVAREEAAAAMERVPALVAEGRADRAEDDARRALRLLEHVDSPALDRAEAHAHVAWALLAQRRFDAAAVQESAVARVCAVAEPASDPSRVYVMHLLGTIHQGAGRPGAALRWWTPTLAALRSDPEPDPSSIAWVGNDVADQLRRLGRAAQAESLQVVMVREARHELAGTAMFAVLLNNLGAMYWDQDRLAEAEAAYREALDVSRADSTATDARRARAHLNLGVVQHDQHRLERATANLDRALETARRAFAADDPELVYFLLERGRVAASNADVDGAVRRWEEGLRILEGQERARPLYEAHLLLAMGRALADRGELDVALGSFRRALDARRRALGPDHPDLGEIQAERAAVHGRRGEHETASGLAREAIDLLDEGPMHVRERGLAHVTLGRALHARKDLGGARRHYDRALEELERIRHRRGGSEASRVRLLEEHVAWFNASIDLALDRGDVERALLDVERMRARALRDRLTADVESSRLPEDVGAPLRAGIREARARIAATQRELAFARSTWQEGDDVGLRAVERWTAARDSAFAALDDLEARREAELARRGMLSTAAVPSDADALRARVLREGEIALVYRIGARRSDVFLVPATGAVEAVALTVDARAAAGLGTPEGPFGRTALRAAIGGLSLGAGPEGGRRGVIGVGTSGPRDADAVSGALLRVLVPDVVRARVFAARVAVVVPDGDLHLLPFEMLQTRAPDADGRRYWLDDGPALRYAPGLATLDDVDARAAAVARRDRIVLVSDPAFVSAALPWEGGAALGRLPGTQIEAATIRDLVGTARVDWIHGDRATESAFRALADGARVVHLATHGWVDESLGLPSGALIFARNEADASDDGLLQLHECYDLPLEGCELVVLSACSTQRGETSVGEGVFALSRGFLAAGARRTVASLWPVGDTSTARLMERFYALRDDDGGLLALADPTIALRDAKRDLRASAARGAPYHWAAFVLVGGR